MGGDSLRAAGERVGCPSLRRMGVLARWDTGGARLDRAIDGLQFNEVEELGVRSAGPLARDQLHPLTQRREFGGP